MHHLIYLGDVDTNSPAVIWIILIPNRKLKDDQKSPNQYYVFAAIFNWRKNAIT